MGKRKTVSRQGGSRENAEVSEVGRPCVECFGIRHTLTTGEETYPNRPDLKHKLFWKCDCGAFVSCHGTTSKAKGSPAGLETRRLRLAAHMAFDPMWSSGKMKRNDAYRWLAAKLGIHRDDCHIGLMDRQQALEVIKVCRQEK